MAQHLVDRTSSPVVLGGRRSVAVVVGAMLLVIAAIVRAVDGHLASFLVAMLISVLASLAVGHLLADADTGD